MKSHIPILFILLLTPMITRADESEEKEPDNPHRADKEAQGDDDFNKYRLCKNELLFAYGVDNPGYVRAAPMLCTHRPPESCCSRTAESQLLERWANVNRVTLAQNIDGYLHVLKGLFDYYEDIILFAKYVHMNPNSTQKCMESSRFLIMNYLKKDEIVKFIENLENSFEFLKNARKGFYCSMCDVHYQQFFRLNDKKIIFATDFCQALVENTIEAQYERTNQVLPLFTNINILMSCNKDENDVSEGSDSENQVQFMVDEDDQRELNDCYSLYSEFGNPSLYLDTCMHYCRDFKFTSASVIFEGSLRKLSYLYDKLLMKGFNMTDPVFAEKDEDLSYTAEDGTEIVNFIRKEYNFTPVNDIFYHTQFRVENLNSFESIFEDMGIDPIKKSNESKFLFSTEDYREELDENPYASARVLNLFVMLCLALIAIR